MTETPQHLFEEYQKMKGNEAQAFVTELLRSNPTLGIELAKLIIEERNADKDWKD